METGTYDSGNAAAQAPSLLLFTDAAARKVGELIGEEGNDPQAARVRLRAAAARASSTASRSTRTRKKTTPASRTRASSC